ncbi:hypothetical protein ACP4OV_006944 [Aristida adscensionis]
MARDRLMSPDSPEVAVKLIGSFHDTDGRYALPAAPELAALLIGGCSSDVSTFDVIVESHASEFKHISPIHPALMSLQYPLLFPYGDKGFHPAIKYSDSNSGSNDGRNEVSMMEFYCYYMHYRKGQPNPELCSGRLSQQFGVNAYSCVELNRLTFHLFNQDLLRCDTYQGISDAVGQGATTGKDIGVKRMLPSSYIGSKRYMQQNYHDFMAICRAYGPPDKFTTFTCNPKWPEIELAIRFEPGQKYSDRSDMTVRVFHMKLHEYLSDIKEGRIFGPVRAGFNMQYTPLKDVTADSQHWTIKARAVRFSEHRNTDNPPKVIKLDFILIDEQGTTMEGQIFQTWLSKYLPNFKENRVYYIKYFQVVNARTIYRAVDHAYMMRFTMHTELHEVNPIPGDFPLYAYSIASYATLDSRKNKKTFLSDAIGLFRGCSHVIMQKTNSGTKPLRNIYITDGFDSVVVALWNQHAYDFDGDQYMDMAKTKPLVFLFAGVTVAWFNGKLALQGSNVCRWYLNPEIPEAVALQQGYAEQPPEPQWHGPAENKSQNAPTTVMALAKETNPHMIFHNRYTATVKIKTVIKTHSWWYTACDKCKKSAKPQGTGYKCTAYNCDGTSAKPRYCLALLAVDPAPPPNEEEKSIELVFFGPLAEEIIGAPPTALIAYSGGADGFIPPPIIRLYGRQYEVRLSVSPSSFIRTNISYQVDGIIGVPAVPPAAAAVTYSQQPGALPVATSAHIEAPQKPAASLEVKESEEMTIMKIPEQRRESTENIISPTDKQHVQVVDSSPSTTKESEKMVATPSLTGETKKQSGKRSRGSQKIKDTTKEDHETPNPLDDDLSDSNSTMIRSTRRKLSFQESPGSE